MRAPAQSARRRRSAARRARSAGQPRGERSRRWSRRRAPAARARRA